MPKICFLVQEITGQIKSLYDLSSWLRQPKVADKYIRSVNSRSVGQPSGDSDIITLSTGFRDPDEKHVVEKITQWRGLSKADRGVPFDDEEAAHPKGCATGEGVDVIATREGVEDVMWFCERLARANTRRREQLQYWNAHPYDPKRDVGNTLQPCPPGPSTAPVRQVEEAQEVRSQTSTLKPADPTFSRPGPKSVVSKQSFSTAAVSLVHDTKTNVRPKTVYAPTAIGKARSTSVPDPPKASGDSHVFPCPYCGMSLEYSEMQNRQSWQ